MIKRLDRYIFAEILGPLALGFLVWTFILVLRYLFEIAEMVIRRGVGWSTAGELLLLYLPSIVVLTIPMALLFGILVAVGRLSAESELIAIRASGVSLFSLYRPILVLSLVLALTNGYLMLEVLPYQNHAFSRLRYEILQQGLTRQIEPRVFYTDWGNQAFYVFETPAGEERWKNTLLTNKIPAGDHRLVVADWGAAQTNEENGKVTLTFWNAVEHQVNLTDPTDYRYSRHAKLDLVIDTGQDRQTRNSVSRSMRELDLKGLRQRARDAGASPLVRNLARVEMHKRFALPAACVVFALLGLPLGFTTNNRHGGRSSGLVLSMGVILVYWVLLTMGEEMAGNGHLPGWLAAWFPNLGLFAAGLFIMARRNRDRGLALINFSWIRRWLDRRSERAENRRRSRRQALISKRQSSRADLVLRLPSFQLRFPNSIDRYILSSFFRTLLLVCMGCLTVYIVADVTDKVDDILKNAVPGNVLLSYYRFKMLAIIYEIAPIILLVTTLTTFAMLSRNNEVTACKAAGVSLYRLSLPVILAAAGLAGLLWLLGSEVLAASNERMAVLQAQIKGREAVPQHQRADQRWRFATDQRLYNYRQYDAGKQLVKNLQVLELDDRRHLVRRLVAESAAYAGDGWWALKNGWTREFGDHQVTSFERFDDVKKARLPVEPEFFLGELRSPDEMNFSELRQYLTELEATGQQEPVLEVELYDKIAYPTISLVMALVALPFSFLLGRRGALYGIGLAIVLGIVFLALMATFKALGQAAVLPPLIAVWSPSLIFSLLALYLFLGIRS